MNPSAARIQSPLVSYCVYLSLILILFMPAILWFRATGSLAYYFGGVSPPGQLPYVIAKLFGLYAALFLVLQVLYGLISRESPVALYLPWKINWHKSFAWLVMTCALIHTVLFISAVSIRKNHTDWSLLWPEFGEGFYRSSLSLGLVSLWSLIITLMAGWLLLRAGKKWRKLHYFSLVALYCVLAHALLVGSEANIILLSGVYWLFGAIILVVVVWRVSRTFGASV